MQLISKWYEIKILCCKNYKDLQIKVIQKTSVQNKNKRKSLHITVGSFKIVYTENGSILEIHRNNGTWKQLSNSLPFIGFKCQENSRHINPGVVLEPCTHLIFLVYKAEHTIMGNVWRKCCKLPFPPFSLVIIVEKA